MSHIDQKRSVIERLLDSLRSINPEIGYYSKSILSETSTYVVKLSNGKMDIPKGIVDDFELNPGFVSADDLKNIAANFQTLSSASPAEPAEGSPYEVPQKSRRSVKKLIPILSIVVIALIGYLVFTQIQRQRVASEREEKAIQREEKAEQRAEEEHKAKTEAQTKEEKEKEEKKKEEVKKRNIRNDILSYVFASTNNYTYSELGGIYDLEITVFNNTEYLLNNVKVRVKYFKPNGQVWNNRDIDFTMVSPNNIMTIKTPDTERGVKVEVQVIEVKSTELGL